MAGDGQHDLSAEAYGRAALLLVESLIHELAGRSVLTVAQAVSVMQVALDAHVAVAEEHPGQTQAQHGSVRLLSAMIRSLSLDLPR